MRIRKKSTQGNVGCLFVLAFAVVVILFGLVYSCVRRSNREEFSRRFRPVVTRARSIADAKSEEMIDGVKFPRMVYVCRPDGSVFTTTDYCYVALKDAVIAHDPSEVGTVVIIDETSAEVGKYAPEHGVTIGGNETAYRYDWKVTLVDLVNARCWLKRLSADPPMSKVGSGGGDNRGSLVEWLSKLLSTATER